MSKVSILVAVYNDEAHIRTCLDSLLGQTLKDIQIICIDDCSTDSTPAILKAYAARDSRIRVLEQKENLGQAVARNRGIEVADGEYITMVDSDDWLAADALEQTCHCLDTEKDCDCALFQLTPAYEQADGSLRCEPFKNRTEQRKLRGKDAFMLSLDHSIHGVYVARAELFRRYPYDDSCRLYSDDNSTSIHYLHSQNVVMASGEYFYRKHSGSSTIRPSLLRFEFMSANLHMKQLLTEEAEAGSIGSEAECRSVLNFYERCRWLTVVGCYYFFYLHKSFFSDADRKQIRQKFERILPTIEASRLPLKLRLKPGYIPVKRWWLFKVQEETYFFLRKLLSRNEKTNG